MQIQCPHCGHPFAVNNPQPGRYGPKCGECGEQFFIRVADDEDPLVAPTMHELARMVKGSASAQPKMPTAPGPAEAPSEVEATMPGGASRARATKVGQDDATIPSHAGRSQANDDMTIPSAAPRHAPGSGAARPSQAGANDATIPSHAAEASRQASPDETQPSDHGRSQRAAGRSTSRTVRVTREDEPLTGSLDGYELIKLLGRGGMGSVYLARQVSLDRPVALKTMNAEWASDPVFLSRFTREAYAAAQLVHHNIVQIYDIGDDRNINYFSMEYVTGKTLADVTKMHGKMDVEEAAGYILQAARGLKFAHDHGMIHRDIKPDNLMLNEEGIVKVADLGLVKAPGFVDGELDEADGQGGGGQSPRAKGSRHSGASAHVTGVDVAMGTPAYMAPEQAKDAANVDERADVYSLGCTFYALLTGRPVFEGNTAAEVITKHASAPVIPPESIAKRVPQSISAVVQKMLAKRREDRFQNMDAVIEALEDFLGIVAGPFTPREEHVSALEHAVEAFNGSMIGKLAKWLPRAFFAAGMVLTVLFILAGASYWAGGTLALMVMTGLSYFVIAGVAEKDYVFRKVRQFAFGSSLFGWAKFIVGVAAALTALWLFGLFWMWLGVAVVSVGLALAFHLTVNRVARRGRQPLVEGIRDMIKSMRLRGLEEDALRRFICRYSGRDWEPFYEALFGYESKIKAREKWGLDDEGRRRKRHGAVRDMIVEWVDQRQQEREEFRQMKHLQKVEEKRLKAQGRNAADARRRAASSAETMVSQAMDFRDMMQRARVAARANEAALEATRQASYATQPSSRSARSASPPNAPSPSPQPAPQDATLPSGVGKPAPKPSPKPKILYGDEDETGQRQPRRGLRRRPQGVMGLLFGARLRFVVGVIMIFVAGFWLRLGDKLPAVDQLPGTNLPDQQQMVQGIEKLSEWQLEKPVPIQLPLLPQSVTDVLCTYGSAVAGVVLVISAIIRGGWLTLYLLPGLFVLLTSERMAEMTPLDTGAVEQILIAVGLCIALAGMFFGRDKG